jgi:hypothetical protein
MRVRRSVTFSMTTSKPGAMCTDATFVQLSAGVHQRLVLPGRTGRTQQEKPRRRPGIALAEQACAEHPRRVQDQRLAGGDEIDEISEAPVLERA